MLLPLLESLGHKESYTMALLGHCLQIPNSLAIVLDACFV